MAKMVEPFVKVGKAIPRRWGLVNVLLLWVVVSTICWNNFALPRVGADSVHYDRGCRPQIGDGQIGPASFAFVRNVDRRDCHKSFYSLTTKLSPLTLNPFRSHRRMSLMLEAGRERRLSNSANTDQNRRQQFSQMKQKIVEKEELERRKRLEQLDQRIQKLVRVEERIGIIEDKLKGQTITEAERSELEGLKRLRDNFEEQYDPTEFSEEHLAYKAMHNDVFARLVRWCEIEKDAKSNLFFLDGPDGGTASSLIHQGNFDPSQCYVANRHESTCASLRESGGGLLPEENVVYTTSSEAFTKGTRKGAFADIDFTGFYFDGCGGYAPHIVNMISSALLVLEDEDGKENKTDAAPFGESGHPIIVGYSLIGGTKNLVEKELEVSRALTVIARTRGMRMVHALDDPSRFGLPDNVNKLGGKGGTTFTTWLVLEPEPNLL